MKDKLLELKDSILFRFISIGLLMGFTSGYLISEFIFKTLEERVIHNSIIYVSTVCFGLVGMAIYYQVTGLELDDKKVNKIWFIQIGIAVITTCLFVTALVM